MLKRLSIDAEAWELLVSRRGVIFGRAMGRLDTMRLHAATLGQSWVRGVRSAERVYSALTTAPSRSFPTVVPNARLTRFCTGEFFRSRSAFDANCIIPDDQGALAQSAMCSAFAHSVVDANDGCPITTHDAPCMQDSAAYGRRFRLGAKDSIRHSV
jgi:hypothetical protein